MVNKLARALLAASLAFCLPAYPWGFTGHRVIALVAEQRLSPQVKDRIDRLLFNGRYSLRDIAACADQIRAMSAPPPPPGARRYAVDAACTDVAGVVTGNTGPWHYINIPISIHSGEKDLEKFCPKGDCIVDQTERLIAVLRDSNDDAERRQALLFVVHFMGDIHQPLHVVDRDCDQGGNRELVNFYLGAEERANQRLHAVWDTSLLDKLMKDSDLVDEQAVASDLLGRIDEDDAARWARATIPRIAWESYAVAKKRVYRGIPLQDFCGAAEAKPEKATDLTRDYESAGARTVREQLMKAGVRLAATLNQNVTH